MVHVTPPDFRKMERQAKTDRNSVFNVLIQKLLEK